MSPSLRFCVLGPLQGWADGRPVALGPPQQQVVLAALLLHEGRVLPVVDLMSAIWGTQPPRAAAVTVRTYISRLRRILAEISPHSDATIDSFLGSYRLRIPDGSLDFDLFQHAVARARLARRASDLPGAASALRETASLWRGEPLAGLSGPFVRAHAARLSQALSSAREDRLTVELELGHHSDILAELSSLAVEDPLNEHLHELLMLALQQSGRTAQAHSIYDEIQRRLAEELGVDPGPRLQAAREKIGRRDDNSSRAAAAPATKASRAESTAISPHQLPADLADFVGRTKVLDDIVQALTNSETVSFLSLHGMGGIGKTTLAVRASHAVKDHFPDGQIFVQLDALSDRPADPHDVLAGLLRTLGVTVDRIPATLSERAALWRSTSAGRRLLIVLDDARDIAQIRDLLPSADGCAVIVTGRRRILELAVTHSFTLGAFAENETAALLAEIVGRPRLEAESHAAEQLATDSSHIPHVVRLVAFRIVARPRWSLAQIAHHTSQEMHQITGHFENCTAVAAPFQRGYRRLDPQQARAFRMLAVVQSDGISTASAAAMLDLSEDLAERLLESLADVHLVEAGQRGWYRYTEVIRLFARHRAFIEDGRSACLAVLERLLRFQHVNAARALAVLETIRPESGARVTLAGSALEFKDRESARAWLDLERENIDSAVREAEHQIGGVPAELRRVRPLLARLDLETDRTSDGSAVTGPDRRWEHQAEAG